MLRKPGLLLLIFSLCAAGASYAAEVFDKHPRLLFRDSAWGERSILSGTIRARMNDSCYNAYKNRLTYSPCNVALRAVMLNDSAAAVECISMMEAPYEWGSTTDDGIEVMWRAFAFDWLYNDPRFSATSKNNVVNRLDEGAAHCVSEYVDQGAHIFHTRMYAFATGAGVAGLAIKGHHLNADTYINWAYDIYTKDLFPARELQGGSVHGSLAYGRKYIMWTVGQFMAAWYSATGEDLWAEVRREQDDWAWREAEFIMYARQPDGLLVRYGDNFNRTSERFSFRVIGERAFAYTDPIGAGYLNYLFETQSHKTDNRVVEEGNAYHVYIYWDANNPGATHTTLPKRTIFSQHGTGMVFWRTGWADDDTFIFFKCGNYFDDHGHFDQGHLEVFRRAPLLIESGYYYTFDGPDRMDYYRKTVAHSTILAVDPSVADDEGGQRIFKYQSAATMQQYLSESKVETGDITRYLDQKDWAYLAGDISAAYPAERVRKAVRELAWLGERFLVVVDHVSLTDSKFRPKVLWHYTRRPVLEHARFTVADSGARAVVTVLAPETVVFDTVATYRVGNAFYPPSKPTPAYGVGRVEVGDSASGKTDFLFVEVIDIADTTADLAAPALKTDSTGALTIETPAGTLTLAGAPENRDRVEFKSSTVKGDFNGDGKLGIMDLIQMLVKSKSSPGDPSLDLNGDGKYTVMDLIQLLVLLRNPQ